MGARTVWGWKGVFASLALVTAAVMSPTAQSQAKLPYEGAPFDSYVRTSVYVPVRDGTRLAVNIYRPARGAQAAAEKLPVIFVFTPYRARFVDEKGAVIETALAAQNPLRYLLSQGYVVAVADIRGKGASFGHRRGFQDRTEARDGYDLVGWLSQQPFADGKVGMWGCSYLGGATLQVASTQPPALKAIFTGASDLDKYDFVRRGGITAQFNTRPDEPLSVDLASVPVDEDPQGSLLKSAVEEHAANTPMGPLWYDMPWRDSLSKYTGNRYWEEVGPYTYLDSLKKSGISTFVWGNWQDEPTAQVLKIARNLKSRLIVGPGLHCVPPPGFDMNGLVGRYFDSVLKGRDNGFSKEPAVRYWVDNAAPEHQWVSSSRLPGDGVKRTVYYAQSDGKLLSTVSPPNKISFPVDFKLPPADYFAFWIDPMEGHGPAFTTPPLVKDQQLLGSPIVTIHTSSDHTEERLFAYLEDVDASGKSTVISFGRLAASYRKLASAPYDNLGLPWHSGLQKDSSPVEPGKWMDLKFDLLPRAWVFKAGHSLRLVITGADPRQRNLKDLVEEPAPIYDIGVGGSAGTRIEIPLVAAQ